MKMKFILFSAFVIVSLAKNVADTTYIKQLTSNETISYDPAKIPIVHHNKLVIYCYAAKKPTILHFLETAEIILDIGYNAIDDYNQFISDTAADIIQNYENNKFWNNFPLFSQKLTYLRFSPFENKCIGIRTDKSYKIKLINPLVNIGSLFQLCLGLALIFYASSLSRYWLFYYLTGILMGIFASIIFLFYIVSKIFPKGKMMTCVAIGGGTIGAYMLKKIWDNLQTIISLYYHYLLWYIFITSIISFFICYRFGPPTNERSLRIIMWIIQIFGGIAIYNCSYYSRVSVVFIILAVIAKIIPKSWLRKLCILKCRHFPQHRLLTIEEYTEQSIVETRKSLQALRQYANSPNCRQWMLTKALANPKRFADFAIGASDITPAERERFAKYINIQRTYPSYDYKIFNGDYDSDTDNSNDDTNYENEHEYEDYITDHEIFRRHGDLFTDSNGEECVW